MKDRHGITIIILHHNVRTDPQIVYEEDDSVWGGIPGGVHSQKLYTFSSLPVLPSV